MAREIGQVDAGGFCCGCGDNDTAFEVFCEALEARRKRDRAYAKRSYEKAKQSERKPPPELEGEAASIQAAVDYLAEAGVKVEEMEDDPEA